VKIEAKGAPRGCAIVAAVNAAYPDEQSLLLGLRAGEDGAFEALVRSHAPRSLAVARRFLRNDSDAEDAVQEAFLAAFKAIDRFEGAARLSTWLHRIVVNAALMKLRSRRGKPEEAIEELLPRFLEDGHHQSPPHQWEESAEELLEREEIRAHVRTCIDQLPESYRIVLLIRDIEEVETAEAATMLGITEAAVKVRLHRARQALRGLLDPRLRCKSV
jgi:RNA polymerase sigma-70 factor (ECF subfamily)